MSLAASCRRSSERLRSLHVFDRFFRVERRTYASLISPKNISDRCCKDILDSEHSAGAGPPVGCGTPDKRGYHATNSDSSLRQDAKSPSGTPHYPWTVTQSFADAHSPDGAGLDATRAHGPLESTSRQEEVALSSRVPSSRAMSLDGRECGARWLSELVPSVKEASTALGRPPGLCVIHVGERRDSQLYVSKKEGACKEMQISSTLKHLPATASQEQLHAVIDAACADETVDGVLVQLPLPPHLNEFDVMERLDPHKDVDGFHPLNMGRMLARNAPQRFVPATALGCMQLLKMYNISVTKKHVVVVGDSNIVGTPLSVLLRDAGAGTVTVCHRIAYTNIFEDRLAHGKTRQLRPHAHACLPRLPGPYSPEYGAAQGTVDVPKANKAAKIQEAENRDNSSRRPCSPPDAARVTVVQKADATTIVVEATDRPGLLKSLASVFCDLDLSVRHADVQTHEDGNRIRDVFELTDATGAPVQDARKLRRLSALVRQHVGGVVVAEPGTWDDGHLAALTRTADVLVVAVGYPELVKGDWVKPGAVVLDVGINVVPVEDDQPTEPMRRSGVSFEGSNETGKSGDGRVVGDVAFREVARQASAVTPVPGGVGPMTIAALIHNVVLAAQYRAGIKQW